MTSGINLRKTLGIVLARMTMALRAHAGHEQRYNCKRRECTAVEARFCNAAVASAKDDFKAASKIVVAIEKSPKNETVIGESCAKRS